MVHEASELMADEKILRWEMSQSAIPSTLKALMREPVIVMGYLHWLRATIRNTDFLNSTQFNHVMQVSALRGFACRCG
jgi:hypothetical protein